MSATQTRLGQERVYTMRELSQDTSGVIAKILDTGRRALLTKRGQFIAAIQPLDPGVIESQAASAIAHRLGDGSAEGGNAVPSSAVAAVLREQAAAAPTNGTQAPLDADGVYTMRELSQDTSGVIAKILDARRRALLTKRGQLIAAIQPLDAGVIESRVASVIADYLGDGSAAGGHAVTTDFAATMLEIDTRKFGRRE
jgi:antitoxin (DNA-binding transcriptional repressor) of toxin-antitoxin stability system